MCNREAVTLPGGALRNSTFDLCGTTYEVAGRHLASKQVTIVVDGLTDRPLRATWQEQVVRFGPCDPVKNRHRSRGTTASGGGF